MDAHDLAGLADYSYLLLNLSLVFRKNQWTVLHFERRIAGFRADLCFFNVAFYGGKYNVWRKK